MKLRRRQKLRAREIARSAYVEANGSPTNALELASVAIHRECNLPEGVDVPEEEPKFGSLISILTVAYLMMCIVKLLLDFWYSSQVQVPSEFASEAEGVDWDDDE